MRKMPLCVLGLGLGMSQAPLKVDGGCEFSESTSISTGSG